MGLFSFLGCMITLFFGGIVVRYAIKQYKRAKIEAEKPDVE